METVEIEEKINYTTELAAPIAKGIVVGTIELYKKGTSEKLSEKNLVVLNDIKKSGFKEYIGKTFHLFMMNC